MVSSYSRFVVAVAGLQEILLAVTASPLTTRQYTSQQAQTIDWGNCPGIDNSTLQCGNLTVPLSYSNVSAGNVTLVLFKLPSSSNSSLGSLVYNPGGPGYSVEDLMVATAEGAPLFSEELLASYDLIGYDPRGVGRSTPVQCDPNLGNQRVSAFPRNESEYQALVAYNKAFGQSCANLTGPLIDHLDTTHVAKDLELVRLSLNGGAKLRYFGQSYGSQIGYQYAELYPQNIDRMILDGILDHTTSETDTGVTESQTYELVLKDFFSWCNNTANCTLQGQDIQSIWHVLTDQNNASLVQAPGCVDSGECRYNVSREEIRTNAQGLLLFQNQTAEILDGWDFLAQALSEAYQGNATLLSVPLADSPSSSLFASLAIGCQDWVANTTSFAQLDVKMRMLRTFNPLTYGTSQSYGYQTSCIGWPAATTNPQTAINQMAIAAAPPIVLVQSTYDPSCSLVWATNVHRQLPGSILVTRIGAGHTSYHLPGQAMAVMDAFMIDGKVPEQDTVVYS